MLFRKLIELVSRMKSIPVIKILLILLLTISVAIGADEDTGNWIGSFSSEDYEDFLEPVEKEKIYYYWQMEKLKKAVAPRYVRYIDSALSLETGKLLNRGILFTFEGIENEEVSICGNFSLWRCIPLKKNSHGVFYIVLNPESRDTIREELKILEYKFRVDGLFTHDPSNPDSAEDGNGSLVSKLIAIPSGPDKLATTRILEDSPYEELEYRTVEFRIYAPDAEMITLVGDFNHWDPEEDVLKKDNEVFTLIKKMKPGNYLYNFVQDGKIILDTFNQNTRLREDTGEISSYLTVPERSYALEAK
ncbi:early set domain-containing protein [Leptospira borgpetersenii]|uniref:carbohydrate-binding module 48 n=1 Tax=Leptospira borgpetersenii TaxID=174 RepID=UPI0007738002|nr:carbohydrate-binding module 48 [Leptospira borgpetersenii]MBE8400848.1 carbohydrate-binding module 48 [Leptospira borgpetersenii serovar Tarassovi]MBE8403980.1 carbohydrate-binding module 48 [Leptospira borgpetersenii serovar Tarassovi]MBE8406988.1 carbohydrate-binding module 48 [Leptospira borgpetersenii serovar Tarassovi]MBE8413346.1 carbohydrate-binding module 48 [Leptospira borgpetersenii serovar Tarassovi]MBE8416539.1 carbohydrate-binding module 48 [Leptospira borgpetersenii serovar Ta